MLVTEKLQSRGVGVKEPPLKIMQVDALSGVKEGSVAFLALPQCTVCLPALRRSSV